MKRSQQYLLAVALLGLLAFGTQLRGAHGQEEEDDLDLDIEDSKAMLVVTKTLKEDTIAEGADLVVEIKVYNVGASTAAEVTVDDKFPKKMFTLKEGSTKTVIKKLSAGSDESFQYTLTAISSGHVKLSQAAVSYLVSTDNNALKQMAKSTGVSASVLTAQDYIIRNILIAGAYITLGTFSTIGQWQKFGALALGLILIIGANRAYTSFATARKSMKRKKALAALEKSD